MGDLNCMYFVCVCAALFVSALRSSRRWYVEQLLRHLVLLKKREHSAPHPHPPRSCHLQDGRQENSVLNTTSQQMFALVQSVQTSNWIHCRVLSSAARTLGMTVIINTLVETLIKPATNYRGLVQLAAAVSSVTEQLSCLVNYITCLRSEIAVGRWKLN